MGYGAASLCNWCLTFRYNLLVSSTMVEISKNNEITRLYRNGGHLLPSVAAPCLKRTLTSVGKVVNFSCLGLIWEISEFVSRDWGKPRRTRLYVVCSSRFEPLTSRIRIRRALYPTTTCDDLSWYRHIACLVFTCVGVPILLCLGSLSLEYMPFNYRRV